jgi:hypothetical protein
LNSVIVCTIAAFTTTVVKQRCLPPMGNHSTWSARNVSAPSLKNYVTPVRTAELPGSAEQPQSLTIAEAKDILNSELFLERLPTVDHVNLTRLPVLDGSNATLKLLSEGYDNAHQVLTAQPSVHYSTTVAFDDAKTSLNRVLGGFPFADPQKDKAAALAAMMTPFVAELLPPKTIVPAFLCDGDRPGLGKGLIVQLAMVPVHGSAPAAVKAKDEEEMRKLLLAVAREGRHALFLDNVAKLKSASLESFITTPIVAGRVLGRTEIITCPKSTVVFATGNNTELSPDMERRTVIIRLAAREETSNDAPTTYLDELRINELKPEILGALYGLAREWVTAERPKPARVNLNFVRWSEITGGIVEHAGFGLPY